MLAHIGAVFGLVVLVGAVDGFFHTLLQQAVVVLGEQRVPHAAPDHLDHVPASATEDPFQLLDDLAVATHRAVQPLQVAVDHENQVIQLLAAGLGDGTQGLRLVALAVADKTPDLANDQKNVEISSSMNLTDFKKFSP